MFETRISPAHAKAYDRAHQLRAETLRRFFSKDSAARPAGVVTTDKGAGRAQPAPC